MGTFTCNPVDVCVHKPHSLPKVNEDTMCPVEGFINEWDGCWSSATKEDGINWNTSWVLPFRVDDRHSLIGVQNREFGCAAGFFFFSSSLRSCQFSCPVQVVIETSFGVSSSRPFQNTPPSLVMAVLVKMVFLKIVFIALGFEVVLVPGATPKKPFSGLMALSRPSGSNFIHAMSSPTHSAFHPRRLGVNMAKFVLPQALGKAAAMYFFTPWGLVMPKICVCV